MRNHDFLRPIWNNYNKIIIDLIINKFELMPYYVILISLFPRILIFDLPVCPCP